MSHTYFYCKNPEALTVLIRHADACGEQVVRVVPVNEAFAVIVTGKVEINQATNTKPYLHNCRKDTNHAINIVNVGPESFAFVGIGTP